MITLEKLGTYEAFNGDMDGWTCIALAVPLPAAVAAIAKLKYLFARIDQDGKEPTRSIL